MPNSSPLLTLNNVETIVRNAVNETKVVDVHTHLFPDTHDDLFAYGIDELLTYHYLIAEFFAANAGSVDTEYFFSLSKREQAGLIWNELFLKRSPISEACLGVLTVLKEFGLEELVRKRDLEGIRSWYSKQSRKSFQDLVFEKAGVRYAVMTNIPFAPVETKHWIQKKTIPQCFKAALRVDPLLTGD
eukprot:g2630.t1